MTDDDAILKQLGARVREEDSSVPADIPPFDAAAEDRIAARLLGPPPAKVIRPRRWLWTAAPLVAAAALVLFMATRPSALTEPPPYEVSLVSVTPTRAPSPANDGDLTLDPDGDIELVARPTAPIKNARVRAILIGPTGAQPWPVPLDISSEGAIRLTGPTRTLFPSTTAPFEIVLFISAGDTLPTEPEALRLATSGPPPSPRYRIVRTKLRFLKK